MDVECGEIYPYGVVLFRGSGSDIMFFFIYYYYLFIYLHSFFMFSFFEVFFFKVMDAPFCVNDASVFFFYFYFFTSNVFYCGRFIRVAFILFFLHLMELQ